MLLLKSFLFYSFFFLSRCFIVRHPQDSSRTKGPFCVGAFIDFSSGCRRPILPSLAIKHRIESIFETFYLLQCQAWGEKINFHLLRFVIDFGIVMALKRASRWINFHVVSKAIADTQKSLSHPAIYRLEIPERREKQEFDWRRRLIRA